MNKTWIAIPAVVALLAGAPVMAQEMNNTDALSAPKKSPDARRAEIRKVTQETLETVYQKHPTAKEAIAKSAGYAVFNNGSATVIFAGAGGGSGMAVDPATGREVFMQMIQLKGGIGLGVKNSRLVLVFNDKTSFHKFVTKGWVLGGEAAASAKAGDVGGGLEGARSLGNGVYAYQFTENGADAEVTVTGTKYSIDHDLSPKAKK